VTALLEPALHKVSDLSIILDDEHPHDGLFFRLYVHSLKNAERRTRTEHASSTIRSIGVFSPWN
jgi:hypothetical protein